MMYFNELITGLGVMEKRGIEILLGIEPWSSTHQADALTIELLEQN